MFIRVGRKIKSRLLKMYFYFISYYKIIEEQIYKVSKYVKKSILIVI